MTVKPSQPARWIGDEFNEQVDRDGAFGEDDDLPEEISAYTGLRQACSAIHRMGAVLVVVSVASVVLYTQAKRK